MSTATISPGSRPCCRPFSTARPPHEPSCSGWSGPATAPLRPRHDRDHSSDLQTRWTAAGKLVPSRGRTETQSGGNSHEPHLTDPFLLDHYKKALPLDTPTVIELAPANQIKVTLFGANHCIGSVMFLIEDQKAAILYTGDVRSEPWFVNALTRHPVLIPYTHGLRMLDQIYLDTSHLSDIPFLTKADGLAHLLKQVAEYPADTIFYMHTWTYGYEDVWIALANALDSKIHVDDYKLRVYSSLNTREPSAALPLCPEAPALVGFFGGNTWHSCYLTADTHVRIHSCNRGNPCSVMRSSPVVHIQPVVACLPSGQVLAEADAEADADDIEPEPVDTALCSTAGKKRAKYRSEPEPDIFPQPVITFPYARHASLPELRHLVSIFRPRDVWPCTAHPRKWVENGISIAALFGEHCSRSQFEFDAVLAQYAAEHGSIDDVVSPVEHESQCTPWSVATALSFTDWPPKPATDDDDHRICPSLNVHPPPEPDSDDFSQVEVYIPHIALKLGVRPKSPELDRQDCSELEVYIPEHAVMQPHVRLQLRVNLPDLSPRDTSTRCPDYMRPHEWRHVQLLADPHARNAALEAMRTYSEGDGQSLGLLSTTDHHTTAEKEL